MFADRRAIRRVATRNASGLLLLVVAHPVAVLANQDAEILELLRRQTGLEWTIGAPWGGQTPEWSCVQQMRHEWYVGMDSSNGSLRVTRRDYRGLHGTIHPSGPVFGTNGGEFGGDVRWVRGQRDTVVLVPDNFIQFIPADSGLFVLAGLAHMTLSRGSLWFLKSEHGVWTSQRFADLGDEPQAGVLVDSTIFIVTLRRLAVVSLGNRQVTVRPLTGWWAAYANSIARSSNGLLYIGLRQGVARVRLTGDSVAADWLMPRTQVDSLRGRRCH